MNLRALHGLLITAWEQCGWEIRAVANMIIGMLMFAVLFAIATIIYAMQWNIMGSENQVAIILVSAWSAFFLTLVLLPCLAITICIVEYVATLSMTWFHYKHKSYRFPYRRKIPVVNAVYKLRKETDEL
jgi:hypothetical protein